MRKEPVSRERPSDSLESYWIFARAGKKSKQDFRHSGKWMLMALPKERIDEVWETVVALVTAGQLGPEAKVSTARPNPNSPSPGKYAIMIYAYDWRDTNDLRRILRNLRTAGLATERISFKRDDETFAGAYQNSGSKYISVFIAEPGSGGDPIRLYTKWLGSKTYLDGKNDKEVVATIEEHGRNNC